MPALVHVAPTPGHPHVVRRAGRRNMLWMVEFAGPEADGVGSAHGYRFDARETLDAAGRLTATGRAAIVRRLAERARRLGEACCAVWSDDDCTWIDEGGRTTGGNRPPTGEIAQNHLLDRFDADLEDVWTIALPDGCSASHVCLRRIDASCVEVTPGEPVVLGSFHDLPRDGRHDPAASMTVRGRLRPPPRYRGQPVTGVRDGWEILGPVQPCRDGAIIRNPWPADVRRACEDVAGRPLPESLHRHAWRALNPDDPRTNHVGVLKAA